MADISGGNSNRRLTSWKEIAAFFGRDERTVKRWETSRGLPVRRVPGGARTTVFAYADELERWLQGPPDQPAPEPEQPNAAAADSTGAEPARVAARRPRPVLAVVLAVLCAFGLVVAVVWLPSADLIRTLRGAAQHEPLAAARELYLSGAFQLATRTEAGLRRAISDFDAAIALDPDYAAAHAGLANTYNLLSQYTLVPAAEAYPKAKEAAERAIALDASLADGYAALAFNEFYWGRNFTRSSELFERAVALAPEAPQVLHWFALTSMQLGDLERASQLITRAQELDPDSRPVLANKALIYFNAGRVDEALRLLTGLRQEHPDYLATPSYLATIYLAIGRYPEFLTEYETAATVEKNAARIAIAAAARAAYEQRGSKGMLEAMLVAQLSAFAENRETAFKVAATAALLKQTDRALELLAEAVNRNESNVLGMRLDPSFRSLHSESRFNDLLRRVGLPAFG